MKLLMTTDIYDDTNIMPNKNKIILGISILWIIPLIIHSYHLKLYIFCCNLIIINIASYIYWYNYKINSLLHKIDKYSVILCFTYIFIYERFIYFIINSLLLLLPYILSSISSINNNFNIQLYSHQLFRYFSFKLICDFINYSYNRFYIYSIYYFIFSFYLFKIINNDINYFKHYINNSFKILLIILINELLFF